MGLKANKVLKEAKPVRNILYGDGYYCKKIKNGMFNQYILDNKNNEQLLDEAIRSKGIKVVVAPTGAGKSYSLIERAKVLVSEDKNCKVIIALPLKTLTLQLGSQEGVYKMVGGDSFDTDSQIIATTYEKMFEIENYILSQKYVKQKCKFHLILDESHLLVSQHLFRENAIKNIIRYIEQGYFDSVLLVTATPSPMSLFRCDEIIEFEGNKSTSAMDKIEIVVVDDVLEYIINLDYDKEFPFIRLNNKAKIEELISTMPQKMVRIATEDKGSKYYKDIVDSSKIDDKGIDGMLVTSVLEAGVNITDYPDDIVPIAVYTDWNISADDIEQFLNRIRRTTNKKVKCARVVLPKVEDRDCRASLVSGKGNLLCTFEDIVENDNNLEIHDVNKMDSITDGAYMVRIVIGKSTIYKPLTISTGGTADISRYCKMDSAPVVFKDIIFRPFIDILKSNYYMIDSLKTKLQENIDVLLKFREARQQKEGLSDTEIGYLEIEDDILIEKMTKGVIDDLGEMKYCLSYEKNQIVVDKRVLYMLSYNQYQRQYYYNHKALQKELAERLKTKVMIVRENVIEEKHASSYNTGDIWEDIENIRQLIICNDDYWNAIIGRDSIYLRIGNKRKEIQMVREQTYLIKLLKEMDKSGVSGGIALQILTSSRSKRKITQYINCHKVIINNQLLQKFSGKSIDEIPFYNKSQKEKMQAAIYCTLKNKGQTAYTVNEKLIDEVIECYAQSFPLNDKIPTHIQIKKMLKIMYKTKVDMKGSYIIKNELNVNETDVFKLIESDYV